MEARPQFSFERKGLLESFISESFYTTLLSLLLCLLFVFMLFKNGQ